MKKNIAIFLLLVLSMATIGFAGNIENSLKTLPLASEIRATGMPLQELLDRLHQVSGIELVAVPEVADLKVDLIVTADQTVASVLAALQEKYGLTNMINEAKTAVIVMQGHYDTVRMYSGKAVPMASPMESNRMTSARPAPGSIRPVQ